MRLILLLLVSCKLAKRHFTKPPDTVRSLSLEHAQFMVQIYEILLRLAAPSFLVAMGPHLICLVHQNFFLIFEYQLEVYLCQV